MKKTIMIAFAMLCLASAVLAEPISLPAGPVYFQFNNLEQVDIGNTEGVFDNSIVVEGLNGGLAQGNWGIVNISSIQFGGIATPHEDISGGGAFFVDDGTGDLFGQGQVYGVFYGIQLTSGVTATGGSLALYWQDAATDFVTTACLDGNGCTPSNVVSQFTSGTHLVTLDFATGIKSDGSNTTISSSLDVTNITGSGQADSFANVNLAAGGAWAEALNSDWFYVYPNGINGQMETRDVRFSNFYNLLSSWNGAPDSDIIGLRSNDPARAYVVPEPGTLVLLGLGLAGLAVLRRRK